jgi:glycosyltransferase involved in cell wall biosynthesis
MLVRNDMMNDPRVARHAETLGAYGFRVTVVCTASPGTPEKEKRAGYEILRVGKRLGLALEDIAIRTGPRSALRILLRITQMMTLHFALFRAARKTEAHVYCANDLDTLLMGVLAAGSDTYLVYDSHELWPDMLIGVPEFVKRMLRAYEKLLINRADAVMTVNELIGQVLVSRYSVRVPIEIVYNCPSTETKQRKRRRLKGRRFKIALYQGHYAPERGLENLVRAAYHLLPDIELVFRGYGPVEAELRALASGTKNVRFVPPVPMEQMVDAAQDADVGIVSYIPSNLNNYLASPNKLFEYIHAGLPVAASDVPFMRRVVCSNDIGVVFDPTDPLSIAEALNRVTRPRELLRHRKRIMAAAERYSWQVEGKKLLHLYARFRDAFKRESGRQLTTARGCGA